MTRQSSSLSSLGRPTRGTCAYTSCVVPFTRPRHGIARTDVPANTRMTPNRANTRDERGNGQRPTRSGRRRASKEFSAALSALCRIISKQRVSISRAYYTRISSTRFSPFRLGPLPCLPTDALRPFVRIRFFFTSVSVDKRFGRKTRTTSGRHIAASQISPPSYSRYGHTFIDSEVISPLSCRDTIRFRTKFTRALYGFYPVRDDDGGTWNSVTCRPNALSVTCAQRVTAFARANF